VELRGERVVLRPLTDADRPELARMLATPEVSEWWGDGSVELDPGTADEPLHQFAILFDGWLAGFIQGYEQLDAQYTYAGIDLFLDPSVLGRGLGTDAVRTVARWLIRERGHHRLVIDPRADNARAIAAYTKVGFRPVGILRQYDRGRDGVLRDGLLMDLLAAELVEPQTDGG
jgi:aminoglycoside 6'-N-acetyltransferase